MVTLHVMEIMEYYSFWINTYTGVGLPDHVVILLWIFGEIFILVSIMAAPFYILTNMHQITISPHPCQHISFFYYFFINGYCWQTLFYGNIDEKFVDNAPYFIFRSFLLGSSDFPEKIFEYSLWRPTVFWELINRDRWSSAFSIQKANSPMSM